MSLKKIFFLILKLFLIVIVTSMVLFQIPELRYDFGSKEPVQITSPEQLQPGRFERSTFASVEGTIDFDRTAVFAMHGVRYTYFLLNEYDARLVVRSYEPVDEDWADITTHVGRLRPYHRMPFSRSVRAGFREHFGVTIPDDAYFLARDDVPAASGWTIGATVFAIVLWCVLFYFFFVHKWIFGSSFFETIKPAAYAQTQSDG